MKMFIKLPEFIIVALCIVFTAQGAQLGVNISLPERGGTFVDIVKENYRWSEAGGGGDLTADQVDEHGWPEVDARFVLDYRPVAEWAGDIDDPDVYRIDVSGTYKCAFIGQASVAGNTGGTVENKSYDSSTNTTTFDLVVPGPPGDNHGFILIDFTETKRTPTSSSGSGFTGLRMMRPGYDLTTTKTFTDEFISALTGIKFTVIRYMCFTITNDCEPQHPGITEWSNRKLPDDASQNRITPLGKSDGAAWEYVIALSNQVKMEPWVNVPVSATTEYVTNLATLIRDSLDQGLNVYVESSNEVWNTAPGFNQSQYNQAQAQALGIGEHENHARRTIEIAQIFENVFGQGSLNGRVRVILCSHQPMLKWWVEPMLQYIDTSVGTPKEYIYGIACQTYFGGGVEDGESVDKILNDCHDQITALIDETGGVNEAGRMQWVAKAAEWELIGGLFSYEGGPDHGGGSTVNIANRIAVERHARMADEWTYNLDEGFFKLNANLAMQFTLTSSYCRYGCWGLTDDVTDPNRNYKYEAARKLADSVTEVIETPENIPAKQFYFYNWLNQSHSGVRITYTLLKRAEVEIAIFNTTGQRIKTLISGNQAPALYSVIWDGKDYADQKVASSIYLCRIRIGKRIENKRIVLIR